ncbi:MAG: hypothetical protein ACOC8B_05940 [Gemmatimonadota bacterium]
MVTGATRARSSAGLVGPRHEEPEAFMRIRHETGPLPCEMNREMKP